MENEEKLHDDEDPAVFNMALDTLKRLGKILEEIKNLSYKIEYTIEMRQAVKINLVKQFFIQASPLLLDETVEIYKKEILELSSRVTQTIIKKGLGDYTNGGYVPVYDSNMEKRLDEILIELQLKLQEQRYFMPRAEDEGLF